MILWWHKRQLTYAAAQVDSSVEMERPEYTSKPPRPKRGLLQADPVCPYCGHKYEKYPNSKTKCPSCNRTVIVRSRDKIKRLLTVEQAAAYDDDKADRARINKARNYLFMARLDADELHVMRDQMTDDSGVERSLDDAVMRILEHRLREAKRRRDYEAATWICFARTHFLRDNDREFFPSLQEWHRMKLMEKKSEAIRNREDTQLIVSPGCNCSECKKVHGRILTIDEALRELPLPVKGCANDFPFMGNYWWSIDT